MATAYTQPTQYKAPIKQWDTDLIGKALAYKQQTYDINKEKVQQFYNQLTIVELAKGGDREHLESRLNLLNQQVTQAGGMGDLSQSGAFDAISSYYGQAIDEKVENGYYGTLVGKKIKAEAEQAKKDGKYNDLNLEHSLQDYAEWENDGQVGSEYRGNSSYEDYTDVIAKATEAIEKIKPGAYVDFDSVGNFTYYSVEGEEITEGQIVSRLNAVVLNDPNVQKQMKINAWGEYRGMDDEAFSAHVGGIYDNQIKTYNDRIDELKHQQYKSKKTEDKQEIQNEIDRISKAKQNLISNVTQDKILKNRSGIETLLYENNFVDQMAETYKYNSVKSKGFKTNDGALSMWKEGQANQRHRDSLNWEKDKFKIEQSVKTDEFIASLMPDFESDDPTKKASARSRAMAMGIDPNILSQISINSASITAAGFDIKDKPADAAEKALTEYRNSTVEDLSNVEKKAVGIVAGAAASVYGVLGSGETTPFSNVFPNSIGNTGGIELSATKKAERLFSLDDSVIKTMIDNNEITIKYGDFVKLRTEYEEAKWNYESAKVVEDNFKTAVLDEVEENLYKWVESDNIYKQFIPFIKEQYEGWRSNDGSYYIKQYYSIEEGGNTTPIKFNTKEEMYKYLKQNSDIDYEQVKEKIGNERYASLASSIVETTTGVETTFSPSVTEELINKLPKAPREELLSKIIITKGTDANAPTYDYTRVKSFVQPTGSSGLRVDNKDYSLDLFSIPETKSFAIDAKKQVDLSSHYSNISTSIRNNPTLKNNTEISYKKESYTIPWGEEDEATLISSIVIADKRSETYKIKFELIAPDGNKATRTSTETYSLKDAIERKNTEIASNTYINRFK